ncbi:hypothetical protein [Massilia sp. TS11]|uniref:hypothetical protein n=1 Tax=Massilia sp. TS11 TaxID=2908003 RepID=UPI001EDAAC63|nr:hypothetical protein [Massilia sp. TS11]MCG2583587.1 hypothetical protein [Massilia sp. TS11]
MVQPVKFANRTVEIAKFRQFFQSRDPTKRAIIFRASKSSGISEFLKHLAASQEKSGIAIYFDMAAGGVSQLADALKDKRDERLLCRLGFFFQAPPLISFLSKLVTLSTATQTFASRFGVTTLVGIGEGILLTPFPSTSTARICKMALTWPRPDVLFFLDNAQKKTAEIVQLAQACAADDHYRHVRFVLAVTDETEGNLAEAGFRQRLPFGPEAIDEQALQPIDAQFVAAICAANGLALDTADFDRYAALAGNDMWMLLSHLTVRGTSARPVALGPVSEFLVRLLVVAEQPLRLADMRLLALYSEQIVCTPDAFDKAIADLQAQRIIQRHATEDGEALILLVSDSALPVRAIKGAEVANLAVARDLYDFFAEAERAGSARHSDAALAQLLYRLAHDLDPAALPARAQTLVRIAMAQGSMADAERYIAHAQRKHGAANLHDFFVQISLFVSLQDYARAKEILEKIPRVEFSRYRILRILDAVALNRIRSHADANVAIDRLLAEHGSAEERVLLVSYKIAGLLHEEEWAAASAVLSEWRPQLSKAANYPYLLRTAAAVPMLHPQADLAAAEQMLLEALRGFRAARDAFGEATTVCNLGVTRAYAGDFAAAERDFHVAYRSLAVLGTQHIQESGTNLGTALLCLGEYARARLHMNKLLPMMEMNYPRAITEANLAMLHLYDGQTQQALDQVRALIIAADAVKVLDCARHVRFAGALIEYCAGYPVRATALLDEIDTIGGDSPYLNRLRTRFSAGPLEAAEALALYRTDWMQYWSQNPLQMLPASTLTAQSMFHHVAEHA